MTVDESAARLRALLADPQVDAHGVPASDGEAATESPAPTRSVEDPHDSPLHHTYRLSHDLPYAQETP